MFQKFLHKAQMVFPVIASSFMYAPAAALLYLESLNMILQ